jgi:hypothetical protein
METLFQKISELNGLVVQGKAMEAFEKYYHEDVVMQENENPPTVGKKNNRVREKDFFLAVTEFRTAKAIKVAVGENVSMVEWYYDYTHNEWGVRSYAQISVQEWADGKIIKEKFYYNS